MGPNYLLDIWSVAHQLSTRIPETCEWTNTIIFNPDKVGMHCIDDKNLAEYYL
jgi:hypothetical protein